MVRRASDRTRTRVELLGAGHVLFPDQVLVTFFFLGTGYTGALSW